MSHFAFTWFGKEEAKALASSPTDFMFRQVQEEGLHQDTTQNLFIEGDNLDVLKLLKADYASKVKMIYIDPPYNTGFNFGYNDNFRITRDNYKDHFGDLYQTCAPTPSYTGNTRHAFWLNMMYPRLMLARDMLSDDGVIFISIDEREVHHLRMICNEIFGEYNFVTSFIWEKKKGPSPGVLSTSHEYVLMYCKKVNHLSVKLLPRTAEVNKRYTNPDNDPRGPWCPDNLSTGRKASNQRRVNYYYPIVNPNTGETHWPPKNKTWQIIESSIRQKLENNEIYWGKDGKGKPASKNFLKDIRNGLSVSTLLTDVGITGTATKEIRALFDGQCPFETPKPLAFLQRFLKIATDSDSLVMDFFAGSGSLQHAVFLENIAGKKLSCISVQWPEDTREGSEAYISGFKTVADLSKERLRRASQKIQDDNPLFRGDLGFKVFKTTPSVKCDVMLDGWNANGAMASIPCAEAA